MAFSRPLRWALAVSVGVHLLLFVLARGYWSDLLTDYEDEEESLIEARLLPPPAPPVPPKPLRPAASPAKPVPASSPQAAEPVLAPANMAAAPLAQAAEVGRNEAKPAGGGPVLSRTLAGSGHMRFAVTKGDAGFIVGRALHDWKVDGDRYELKSTIETTGIVALFADVRLGQTSTGRIDAEGLHPETFRDNRKDGQYRSEFDWAQGTLKLNNGTVVPLAPGAQDLLSMFYQLGLYPLDGPELSLMVTNGRKFERYVFRVEADVPLMLSPSAEGRLAPTYHLSYRGREQEAVEVWLAKEMNRLPVRIRYTDRKGGVTEMYAEEINYPGKN